MKNLFLDLTEFPGTSCGILLLSVEHLTGTDFSYKLDWYFTWADPGLNWKVGICGVFFHFLSVTLFLFLLSLSHQDASNCHKTLCSVPANLEDISAKVEIIFSPLSGTRISQGPLRDPQFDWTLMKHIFNGEILGIIGSRGRAWG